MAIDMLGKTSGSLTVVKRLKNNKSGEAIWQLHCSECKRFSERNGHLLRKSNNWICTICLPGTRRKGTQKKPIRKSESLCKKCYGISHRRRKPHCPGCGLPWVAEIYEKVLPNIPSSGGYLC